MDARPHGPIFQTAFVVPDINAGIDHWVRKLQVGPFFKFPKIVYNSGYYRGTPMLPDYDAAVAYSGDLMIELIKPVGPSIFAEFLESGGTGVHHFCAATDDFAAARAQLTARGAVPLLGGDFADGSCLAYFEMDGPGSTILEVAQLSPDVHGLFAAVKQAAATWDGWTPTVSFS